MHQSIPKDWTIRIERGIADIDRTYDSAMDVLPGLERDVRMEFYDAACNNFIDRVCLIFGTPKKFEDFMKDRVDITYRVLGFGDLPEQTWADFKEDCKNINDAESLADLYRFFYQDHAEDTINKFVDDQYRTEKKKSGPSIEP